MRYLAVLVVALVAAGLSGCAESDGSPGTTASTVPTGRTFVSTSVEGADIPGGGPLTLDFTEQDRVSVHAGCNRGSADVDFTDGTMTTGPIAMTLMACPGESSGADAWVTEFLQQLPSWQLDGENLELRNDTATITLTDRKVLDPDRPITGTAWTVTSLLSPDAVSTSAALERSAPQLTIGDDGAVTGNAGCNRITGQADVHSDTIVFGPLATTRMACPEDVAEVERAVLHVMNGEVRVSVDSDTMRLSKEDGYGLELTAR